MSSLLARAGHMVPEPAEIIEKRSYGPDIHIYRLRLCDPGARARYDFRTGQFNMLYVPGVGEVAISISSDPDDEDLEHTIRIVGRTTRVIDQLGVGDVIGLRGPFGRGWPLQEARYKDVLIITGGLGCAPVTGAIDYLFRRRSAYGHVTILHGVKKPADLIHRDRFEYWRRQPDTTVMLTTDQPDRSWRDRSGVVTELFDELTLDPLLTTAFMCGPEVMIRFGASHLLTRGLTADRIHVAIERHMQCGVGLCGHCQLGPHLVCRDGPIFPYSRIEHDLHVRGL